MSIVITPESEMGKELARWEQHQTAYVGHGQRPGNPYVFREYPIMVYKAFKRPDGKVICLPPLPEPTFYPNLQAYQLAFAEAEQARASCFRIAKDEDEYLKLAGQGFCDSPAEALEQFEREEQALGNAAAEAAAAARGMGEKARQELEQANVDAGLDHVADVTPAVKKRLRDQAREDAQ